MRKGTLVGRLWLIGLIWTFCCCTGSSPNEESGVSPDTPELAAEKEDQPLILFFGNSLTAGYGVESDQAFPHLIQLRLDSLGLNYKVVNAGLSGETTASGTNRIEWVLREPVSIMILELGGNDGLRGIDTQLVQDNLQQIIDLARAKYPDIKIILAGMEAPPNMGQDYISKFRAIFPRLAEKNELPLIPFLLQGVGGEAEYNLDDGIHPNAAGHTIVAENVWQVLQSELELISTASGDN